MDDDLDTPTAMALLFDTVRRANAALDATTSGAGALVAAVREMCDAFGLELGRPADDVPADVRRRLRPSTRPAPAKDFAPADAIRAELQADGWTVETTPAAPPSGADRGQS